MKIHVDQNSLNNEESPKVSKDFDMSTITVDKQQSAQFYFTGNSVEQMKNITQSKFNPMIGANKAYNDENLSLHDSNDHKS